MKRLLTICCLALIGFTVQTSAQDQLTVNQWVQPAEDGVLKGRIVVPVTAGASKSVTDASVAILGSDGEVLRSDVKTNEKGEFEIHGVKPGVYALTARADYVFAACAMHVLDSDLVGEQEFPAVVEVSAANVDYTTVKTAMIRYLPAKLDETVFSIADAELESLGTQISSKQTNQVARFQGGMKGRIHAAGADGGNLTGARLTNIFMMQNGTEVARTISDEEGNFFVDNLPAGNYSLLAVGPKGLGLVGFELINDEPATAQVTTSGERLVQADCCCCQQFSMQVAPPEVVNVAQAPVETYVDPGFVEGGFIQEGIAAPLAGDGIVGGGFTGGGGAVSAGVGGGGGAGLLGGGGGLGGLGRLALLGGGLAVAIADDSSSIDNNPVASPVVPN